MIEGYLNFNTIILIKDMDVLHIIIYTLLHQVQKCLFHYIYISHLCLQKILGREILMFLLMYFNSHVFVHIWYLFQNQLTLYNRHLHWCQYLSVLYLYDLFFIFLNSTILTNNNINYTNINFRILHLLILASTNNRIITSNLHLNIPYK